MRLRTRASAWRCFHPGLAFVFLLLAVRPIDEAEVSSATLRAQLAQEIVDELRIAMALDNPVHVAIVAHHPLVFFVERDAANKDHFVLSMELGFEDELRAALAHELGHVWIFTHHPFLHTERRANEISLGVVSRDALAKLYTKLWAYEGTAGVPIEQLLGPAALAHQE